MATKKESRLQRKIRSALEKRFKGSFWVKIWGGPFTMIGVPDLLGCVKGRFCALEVKQPDDLDDTTQIQRKVIRIIRRAGGVAGVVTSPQGAIQYIEQQWRSEDGRP